MQSASRSAWGGVKDVMDVFHAGLTPPRRLGDNVMLEGLKVAGFVASSCVYRVYELS